MKNTILDGLKTLKDSGQLPEELYLEMLQKVQQFDLDSIAEQYMYAESISPELAQGLAEAKMGLGRAIDLEDL